MIKIVYKRSKVNHLSTTNFSKDIWNKVKN